MADGEAATASRQPPDRKDLHLAELLDFRPDQGIIRLHEQRVVILSAAAMGLLRKELVDTLGLDTARRLADSIRLRRWVSRRGESPRAIELGDPLEGLRAGAVLQTLEGIVRADVRSSSTMPTTGRFEEEVVWHDSYVAEQHVHHYGKSVSAGVLVAGRVLERFRQRVPGEGDLFSRDDVRWARVTGTVSAIGRDAESWGDELDAIRADFQAPRLGHEVERLREAVGKRVKELDDASGSWSDVNVS